MKKLLVRQSGKANCEFIVRNPEKIEFWKMVASKLSGSIGLIRTEVKEI